MNIDRYIEADIRQNTNTITAAMRWKFFMKAFRKNGLNCRNACADFSLHQMTLSKRGGNESPIPKKFDQVLYPLGWREIRISGDLIVKKYPRQSAQRRGRFADEPYETETIAGYIDGHNIDF